MLVEPTLQVGKPPRKRIVGHDAELTPLDTSAVNPLPWAGGLKAA
jgi:hypothetical protein